MSARHKFQIVIIGAGIAGLSAAWHLVRKGIRSLLVVEREPVPAAHASGKNAGIFRALDGEHWNAELAARSLRMIRGEPWARGILRPCGVMLLSDPGQADRLLAMRHTASLCGVPGQMLTAEDARGRVPVLAGDGSLAVVLSPEDGVVDVNALCQGLLHEVRAAGIEVRFCCEVADLVRAGGRVTGIRTREGTEIGAGTVANAAGAWAGTIGEAAGSAKMPLRVTRRHLVSLDPSVPVDPEWPVVWHVAAPAYFRPESHGLLASPCDQADCPPGELPVEESAILDLSTSLSRIAPALTDARVRSAWTCNRTLTPDDRVLIGPDPVLPGLFWIAGLGGHGMSTGMEAGRLAAQALTGASPPELRELAPGRFCRSGDSP